MVRVASRVLYRLTVSTLDRLGGAELSVGETYTPRGVPSNMARPRRVNFDDPEDVFVDALEHYPPEFLECRESHDWPSRVPFVFVDTDREDRRPIRGLRQFAERRKICRRCGMVRVEMFAVSTTRGGHTSLHKIAGAYDPPEGYPIKGTGATRGLNDLLRGVMFDAQQRGRRH